MTPKFTPLTEELHSYVVDHGVRSDPLLERLAAETAALGPEARMQISPDEGALLGVLCRAIGARHVMEIGTFTGYSAICMGRALPEDGALMTCEIDRDRAAIARRYIAEAGLSEKVEIFLGPALQTMQHTPKDPIWDLGFIDADKANYGPYYEEVLLRLRPGGLLAIDNVLWGGRVLDSDDDSDDTRAIRELNERVARDERVETAMVPIADGLTLCVKR